MDERTALGTVLGGLAKAAPGHAAITCGAVTRSRAEFEARTNRLARAYQAWMDAVPTMMHRIARLPDAERARHDVSSLNVVFYMAAPCPPGSSRRGSSGSAAR